MGGEEMINEHDIEELAPGFNTWLNEFENFSTRYERLCAAFAHFDAHDHKELMSWLKAAYMRGYYDTEVTLVPEDSVGAPSIHLVEETEYENGDVGMTFDMDKKTTQIAGNLGLKLLLYCGALGISTKKAFDTIWEYNKDV
jgi:hypothetical protein